MNYVVAVVTGAVAAIVGYFLGVDATWPVMLIFGIGYLGGRIAGTFAND